MKCHCVRENKKGDIYLSLLLVSLLVCFAVIKQTVITYIFFISSLFNQKEEI